MKSIRESLLAGLAVILIVILAYNFANTDLGVKLTHLGQSSQLKPWQTSPTGVYLLDVVNVNDRFYGPVVVFVISQSPEEIQIINQSSGHQFSRPLSITDSLAITYPGANGIWCGNYPTFRKVVISNPKGDIGDLSIVEIQTGKIFRSNCSSRK